MQIKMNLNVILQVRFGEMLNKRFEEYDRYDLDADESVGSFLKTVVEDEGVDYAKLFLTSDPDAGCDDDEEFLIGSFKKVYVNTKGGRKARWVVDDK